MKRVLVTGGRAPVALDLARSFVAAGAEVFVADSAPCFLCRSSRSATRAFRVPPPREAPRAFVDAIRTIVRRERIDLIVPTCEEVFYLGRYATHLHHEADLFCPDFALLRELHDKWRFTHLARDLGIDVPETWLLRSSEDLAAVPLRPSQLVFKPVFSRFAVHTLVGPSAAVVAGLVPTAGRPWVAQRYVEGMELCSYSVARDGILKAHSLYRPTWRAGRGSGYYFLPVDRPAVENFITRFVARIKYTGQIAFDFIESLDGRTHVIECNPRATSGVHLFGPSDGLAGAFDGTARRLIRPGGANPAMLGSAMVCIGGWQALRRRRLRAFFRDWNAATDVVWSARDPMPAFYLFVGLGAVLFSAAARGISPQAASTRDIEWDGEELGDHAPA